MTTITSTKAKYTTAADKMLDSSRLPYHASTDMPRYLFGDRGLQQYHRALKSHDKSKKDMVWAQVDAGQHSVELKAHSRQKQTSGVVQPTATKKLEALISRNDRRAKCAIDPDLTAMLNERPGFLPIKKYDDNESPPTITPIISPPPAFQDNETTEEGKPSAEPIGDTEESAAAKGMVFSRSFEYDSRKPFEYEQTFSKSFDYDFLSPTKERTVDAIERLSPLASQRSASTTGYQQYMETADCGERGSRKMRTRGSYVPRGECVEQNMRSRRGQFLKQDSSSSSSGSQAAYRARQQSQPMPHPPHQQQKLLCKRLNSCDSGARSGMLSSYPNRIRWLNLWYWTFLCFASPLSRSIERWVRLCSENKCSAWQTFICASTKTTFNHTRKFDRWSSVPSQ